MIDAFCMDTETHRIGHQKEDPVPLWVANGIDYDNQGGASVVSAWIQCLSHA